MGIAVGGGHVEKSWAHTELRGNSFVGGAIGFLSSNAYIKESHAHGNMDGDSGSYFGGSFIGGFVGKIATNANSIAIKNSYSTMWMSNMTASEVGGFVGELPNGINIATSYFSGSIKGATGSNTGDFIGSSSGGLSLVKIRSFSEASVGDGSLDGDNDPAIARLNAAAFSVQSNFGGWDNSIWKFNSTNLNCAEASRNYTNSPFNFASFSIKNRPVLINNEEIATDCNP